ncbi:hypothetical protein [Caldanaerobius polysaccharolyticus]|uniref:hypothetical protein n=1 Tax=Caldanaerobius polysaccharolyticus TaxID=44256 RepID=UPI00047CE2FE|nr:hypothetical protein [Caldanaerobius polysaccharolyticus]
MSPEYANKYKELSGKVLSKDTKFIKITKTFDPATNNYKVTIAEESENQAMIEVENAKNSVSATGNYDYQQNSWIKLETWLSSLGGGGEYLYKTSFTWLTQPLENIGEYIATGYGTNTSVISGSEYLQVTYNRQDVILQGYTWTWGPTYLNTDYYWTANIKSNTGYGFSFQICDDPTSRFSNVRGTMAFRVRPNISGAIILDA